MFGTIRKHQTWLWAIIITLTIISFVIFFSPYSKMNSGMRTGSANLGSINGERVSEEAYVNAQREVLLRYFFMSGGHWPEDQESRRNIDRETYEWLLLTQKQDQLGIHIAPSMVVEVARNMLAAFKKAGLNSPDVFARYLQQRGLSLDDFGRYVQHFLGVQELISTFGLSGKLVTPTEMEQLYVRERQEVAADVVFFNAANYMTSAAATVTPARIDEFYTNNLADYRIPERRQVSYVRFSVSNYLAQSEQYWAKTNLSESVENIYQQYGTNLFPEAKTPEAAKAKIREQLIQKEAILDARKQAGQFASPLFDMTPVRAENLQVIARTNGLTVSLTAPFDRDSEPKGLDAGPDFAKAAFSRTPEDPFATVVGNDGVYVIALEKVLPSEVPTLDQVRDRVTEDFKANQARLQAQAAGMMFAETATNSLAHGKSFSAICEQAKVKPVALPPFSPSTRSLPGFDDIVNINLLKQMAFRTPTNQISRFQRTSDGGAVMYVREKLPVDKARMNADMPTFASAVRQQRSGEAFNEWFSQEFQKDVRATILSAPAQPPPSLAPGAARKS